MNTKTKITALITSILLTSALAGPAKADTPTSAPLAKEPTDTSQLAKIEAPAVPMSFQRTSVVTTPAPAPKPVEAPVTPQAVEVSPAPAAVVQSAPVAATAAVKATPAPVSASGKGASIAAAAYAQIGVSQDCTMLVTNALRAVGINFHDWPAGYMGLGTIVPASQAQPGDLAYYQNGGMGMAHIAVYVGNGQAIHGGWNGGTTAIASVNVGSGPVFIRVA